MGSVVEFVAAELRPEGVSFRLVAIENGGGNSSESSRRGGCSGSGACSGRHGGWLCRRCCRYSGGCSGSKNWGQHYGSLMESAGTGESDGVMGRARWVGVDGGSGLKVGVCRVRDVPVS